MCKSKGKNEQLYLADIKGLNETMETKGFLYALAFIIVSILSIAKYLVCFAHDLKYRNYKGINLMLSEKPCDNPNFILKFSNAEDYKKVNVVQTPKEIKQAEKDVKSIALTTIGNYLLDNKYMLKGEILKTKYPKATLEEVANEEKPYFVQEVTFGEEINKALHNVYDFPLKKRRLTGQTYIPLNENDIYNLEKSIREDYYNDEAYVLLFDRN